MVPKLKKILLESIIEKTRGHNRVAVALSSGIDSLAIALALKDLGKEVVAYSFHIDGVDSQDWKYASIMLMFLRSP